MNDVDNLEQDMIADNDVIFDTPKKQTESSQFKTPQHNYWEISHLKDTFWFLSPAIKTLHDSIEKSNKSSEFKFDARQLKVERT